MQLQVESTWRKVELLEVFLMKHGGKPAAWKKLEMDRTIVFAGMQG